MVEAKKDSFSMDEQDLARFAKALAHPARIKILKILNEMKGCMVADVVDLLPLAQSTVSQHLEELKQAGLIRTESGGPKRYYCLNQQMVRNARNDILDLFSNICEC